MKKRTGLIATKIGNSSYFSENGNVIPVTVLKVDECIVSNIKTLEKDGYSSIQVVSIDGKYDIKKIKKPQQKLFANIKSDPKKVIKEFRIHPENQLEIGTKSVNQAGNDALAAFAEDDDPLSAFSGDDDDMMEEVVISFEDDDVPEIENSNSTKNNPSESTYKLLLETVWVDDILDPSEVQLLARKRGELGLSFERHLQLVRDIIGG